MSIQDDVTQVPVPGIVRPLVEVDAGGQLLDGVAEGALAVYTTTVGAMLTLTARAPSPILSTTWTVEGMQYAVTGYTASLNVGQPIPLTPDELHGDTLRLSWWKPGTYAVTCTMFTTTGSLVSTDQYVVTAPLVRDFNWQTGVVGVGTYFGKQFLRLAFSMDQFDRDGMLMHAVVAGQQQGPGIVAGIQLACQQRFCTMTDSFSYRLNSNGEWILDIGLTGSVLYQGHWVPLPADGQNVEYDANDGPGAELNPRILRAMFVGDGDVEPVVPEMYRMYLMFKPYLVDAIWVPIKVLEWGWEGYTTYESGAWSPAQAAGIPLPRAYDPVDFPTWTRNTSQDDWVRV